MSSWDQDDFWDDGSQNTSADVQQGDGGPQWGSKPSGGQEGDTASDGQVGGGVPGAPNGNGQGDSPNTPSDPSKGSKTKSKDSKMFLVIGAAILVIAIVSAVVVGVMHKRKTSGSVTVGTSQVQQYQQGTQGTQGGQSSQGTQGSQGYQDGQSSQGTQGAQGSQQGSTTQGSQGTQGGQSSQQGSTSQGTPGIQGDGQSQQGAQQGSGSHSKEPNTSWDSTTPPNPNAELKEVSELPEVAKEGESAGIVYSKHVYEVGDSYLYALVVSISVGEQKDVDFFVSKDTFASVNTGSIVQVKFTQYSNGKVGINSISRN